MRYLYILRYLGGLFWLIQLAHPANGQVRDVTAPHATLRLGAGQPLEVRTENVEGKLTLRAANLRVPLPIHAATSLTTETVQLRGGARLALVRLSAAQERAAVLLARRGTNFMAVWTGRLDFVGDPGERRADAIEVADRDADGHPDIVVGHYDEQVSVCGDQHTLLDPRAVDPKTLDLRPVLLNRVGHRPVSLQLEAASEAPESLDPPPVLEALRPLAASSAAADVERSVAALTDGDLHTFWQEGRGLGGRFEFASLAWDAPSRPIIALALVPVPEGANATARERAQLRSLSVLGPHQEHWKVKLPAELQPGRRYWITPPRPLAWHCLTLAIDELGEPPASPQTHAVVAELEAYTDLDTRDGLEQLVRELTQPGARGDDATALLLRARGDVVGALLRAWPELPALGKRRALRLLFRRPADADARLQQLLRSALQDSDPAIAAQALDLARGKVPFGYALLVELAHAPTPQGDLAVKSIGGAEHPDAFAVLLTILAEPGASERPALREALAEAYRSARPSGAEALHAWTGSEGNAKPRAARAALALALSRVPDARAVATELVHELTAADAPGNFAEQWRLVQATRSLPSEPRGDGFLEDLAQRAQTWMLRAAALDSLAARKAPSTAKVAQHALSDEYPRVRERAVRVLSNSPGALELLSKTARKDPWFLVRRAALEALPDSAFARSWFAQSLADPIAAVRAAAIEALARVRAADAWRKIEPALQNPEEYPEVIAAGVAFARRLCVRAAIPSLRVVVSRGLKPDAWDQDRELALEALEVLSTFGGQAAVWARDRAASSLVPKDVQLAAAAAVHQPPACVPNEPKL